VHNNGSIETPEITHTGIHFLLADIDVYHIGQALEISRACHIAN